MNQKIHITVPIEKATITELTVDIILDENAVITEY